jgi:hypothetical protein
MTDLCGNACLTLCVDFFVEVWVVWKVLCLQSNVRECRTQVALLGVNLPAVVINTFSFLLPL